jgi:hypothetical protein
MLSTVQSLNPQKLENVFAQNAKNSQIRRYAFSETTLGKSRPCGAVVNAKS